MAVDQTDDTTKQDTAAALLLAAVASGNENILREVRAIRRIKESEELSKQEENERGI